MTKKTIMLLHRISWREVTPRLHYLYATTNPTRRYGKEKGWVWLDDSADVYHGFNNHGALGEYPSLEAAKRACETYHDLADDGFGVVHIPEDSLHTPASLTPEEINHEPDREAQQTETLSRASERAYRSIWGRFALLRRSPP